VSDWFDRFGPAAFRALERTSLASPSQYIDAVERRLREQVCWPTRATGSQRFAVANQVVVTDSALEGFLEKSRYLDAALATDATARKLAVAAGAKNFTLASLIRLRCAGADPKQLTTKLKPEEADFNFDDYDEAERKVLYARLLDEEALLGRSALTAIRKSPVMKNERGEWVAPADMVAQTSDQTIAPRPAQSGGWGGGWIPRTISEMERDREVGRRGEELVYRMECERVRSAGYPNAESVVIWTSQTDPGADHDIRSVDEAGRPRWIEVKSTVGNDGRFDWSSKEFEKAVREGDRYELWRVYRASSMTPVAKSFRNPAKMLGESRLQLELGSLRARVEDIG
jgi:hypothetical protein